MPYKMIIKFAPSPMWMSKYDEEEKLKLWNVLIISHSFQGKVFGWRIWASQKNLTNMETNTTVIRYTHEHI
jgi:hypothetical protein